MLETRLKINGPLLAFIKQFKKALPEYQIQNPLKPLIKYTRMPDGSIIYHSKPS